MKATRIRAPEALGPPLAAAFLVTLVAAAGWVDSAELLVRDALLRTRPRSAAASVAAVVVDEEAIGAVGPWPWERERLAALVERIGAAGAAGVAVDLLLAETRPGDEALAAALAARPSVLAAAPDGMRRWLLPGSRLRGASEVAHVSFAVDRDGVVRGFLATRQLDGLSLGAMPLAAARLLRPEMPVPVGASIRPGFRSAGEVPTWSAADVLSGTLPEDALRGRVCFVGSVAAGVGDRVVSPLSARGTPDPGVLVQAAATESILTGDLYERLPPFVAGGLTGVLTWGAMALRRRVAPGRALAAAAVPLLAVPAGIVSLLWAGWELPLLATAFGGLAATAGPELWRLAADRRRAAVAVRRIGELEALTATLESERKDDAEARRVLAHELKTPLTSVRGLAQLLSGFDLSEERRRSVAGIVARESARLAEMVETLLDLERIKLRAFRKASSPIDLPELVRERAVLLASDGQREIRFSGEPGLVVRGDAALLARVVDNLVGNALKFAPGEPVDVAVAGAGGDSVCLTVRDRGPGILPGEREEIFRRFARGGSAAAVPGLGLGLAFVAEIVKWHGARIDVEAPGSGGSLFRVTFPASDGGTEPRRRA